MAHKKYTDEERKERRKESRKKWRESNPEKVKAQQKRKYLNNREKYLFKAKQYQQDHRDEKIAYNRQYFQENKEEFLKQCKQYYEQNKEQINERNRQYYRKNKEKFKEYTKQYQHTEQGKHAFAKSRQKRRALGKNLQNTLTIQEWHDILQNQNHRCAVCERSFNDYLNPTRDHIIPLSKSSDIGLTKENTQALCQSCNASKQNRTFTEEQYQEWKQSRKELFQKNINTIGEEICCSLS